MLLFLGLIARLGVLQIVRGEELKKGALDQWTRGITIKSKRGTIYDREGKKLVLSVSSSTVWANTSEIREVENTAKVLANVLDLNEEDLIAKLSRPSRSERIKQWISKEEANELKKLKVRGIEVVDDNKRYYPYGNFASYVLGFTDIDNNGLEGLEKIFNKELTGTPGRWVKTTDAANRQLPFDDEKIYQATDGVSIVTTIDESIQHMADKLANEGLLANKAKNVTILVMEPFTGDILAMSTKPDYDPNTPRIPLDPDLAEEWKDLPDSDLLEKWYEMWRNVAISDIYEPGSTFKLVTTAAALEENKVSLDSHYYCNGFIRDIKGVELRCARWYNPHKDQNLIESLNNSCNVAFVNIGRQVGRELMVKYIKGFGFGELTGIDLNGEQAGIIPSNPENIKEVELATLSYGYNVAITPIQLVNAVSAMSNGGNLMKPRLVKELIDLEGNTIKTYDTQVKRQVISKKTSDTLLMMMEDVVKNGSGNTAYVPGYRVGGKTGTAQKLINGRYVEGKYMSSFVGVAPVDDPKVVIAVIIDEPSGGQYYGGTIAAPIGQELMEYILDYMDIPAEFTEEELEKRTESLLVPDVVGKKIGEAGKILSDLGLRYTTEYLDITEDSVILDQYPLPGERVNKGSIIDLFLNISNGDKVLVPYLIDMPKEEVISILNDLNINYELKGEGIAKNQEPLGGEIINTDTKIIVEFGGS